MDPPLEKVEPKFCSVFLRSGIEPNQPLGKVEPKFCSVFLKSCKVDLAQPFPKVEKVEKVEDLAPPFLKVDLKVD